MEFLQVCGWQRSIPLLLMCPTSRRVYESTTCLHFVTSWCAYCSEIFVMKNLTSLFVSLVAIKSSLLIRLLEIIFLVILTIAVIDILRQHWRKSLSLCGASMRFFFLRVCIIPSTNFPLPNLIYQSFNKT